MNTKILFLDFDDVLNTADTLARGELFERANVDVLNTVVDRTDPGIVVTSMWRLGATPAELEEILVNAGVHASGRVIGSTPCLTGRPRGAEIAAWFEKVCIPAGRFVILDNIPDMGIFNDFLVQTDPQYGLVRAQVEEIVNRLETGPILQTQPGLYGTMMPQGGFGQAVA